MKILLLFVILFVAATSVVNSKRKVKYDWNNYYSHKNINGFIDSVARDKKWIKTKSIGKTFERRDMRVIEIVIINSSQLEACFGFFRLLQKGKFVVYLL